MKYIKEEYVDKEGRKVYIERFFGKKEQCVLSTDKKMISPLVEHIEYDEEHEVFFVRDSFSDIYPQNEVGKNKANVYFYLDFDGNPLGFAYTDAFDGLFTPMTKREENPHHDRWFIAYGEFKRNIGLEFGKTIKNRTNNYGESAKKMLTVYKK